MGRKARSSLNGFYDKRSLQVDEGELKRRVQRELATWLAVTHKAISGDTPLRTSDQDLQALAKQPMQEATQLSLLVLSMSQSVGIWSY